MRRSTAKLKCYLCVILCDGSDIIVSVTKTRKVGGSLVVTIPKKLAESKKIKEGEFVEITIRKVKKDGFGILKGIKPFTAEDELDTHD